MGDLVLIERGASPRPIDKYITDDPSGLNWVKIGDAPEQGNYIVKTAEKIKAEGLSKTREVHPGDLVLSNSMSFGRPYIMGIDGCIHDGWLLIRDTSQTFDLLFLCILLGTPQMINQYRALAAGSTVNNLNKGLVGNTRIGLPRHDEQKRISEFVQNLDNLIAAHERKLELLKKKKQYYLQAIFSQTLRFKGFNEPWRECKLGEIATLSKGSGYSKQDIRESGTPLLLYGRLYTQYELLITKINTFAEAHDNSVFSRGNEIVVPASGETAEDIARASVVKDSGILIGGDLNIISLNLGLDPIFVALLISHGDAHKELAKRAQGKSIVHLHRADLQTLGFFIPSTNEQNEISNFFEVLNSLITVHEYKLELLKKKKQYYLQELFI